MATKERKRSWRAGVVLGVTAGLLMTAAPAAAQECRGTKQFYQGQCRYPDEISKLKAAAAAKAAEAKRRQEEAARRAEEEKRKAEEEKRKAEEAAKRAEEEKRKAEEEAKRKAEEEAKRQAEQKQQQPPATQPTAPPAASAEPTTAPPTPPPPADEQPPADEAAGPGISPMVWVGFGVAGAGVLVGAITGGISLSQASSLKDECPDNVCSPDKQSDIATMLALGHVATAGLIVGGVGAIVGVLGLVIPGGEEPEADTARIQPFVGPGTIGVTGVF